MEKLYLIIVGFIASYISSVYGGDGIVSGNKNVSMKIIHQNKEKNLKGNTLISEECGVDEACVRFCCLNESDCYSEEHFNLSSLPEAKLLNPTFRVLKESPNCSDMFVETESWMFKQDGSVEQYLKNGNFTNLHHEYCLHFDSSGIFLKICFGDGEDEFDDLNEAEPVDHVKAAYPILMLLSVPFLLVTFLIYGCIGELRNLHGKCLMCYLLGLIVMFLSFSLIQLNHDKLLSFKSICLTTGYVAYISILICFFWLNVMCYDIYSTFRGFQSILRDQQSYKARGCDRKRFIVYSFYAFGSPILITGIVFFVDNSSFLPEDLRIGMGEKRCWIQSSRITELIYVYFPVSIVLLVNIMFYSTTAYKIYKVQKDVLIIRERRNSKVNVEQERFFLYLRLFIVMGATWIIESASWIFKNSLFLHISDMLNCLQGVIIFFLFVWKPKIKNLLIEKFSSKSKLTSSPSSRVESTVVYVSTKRQKSWIEGEIGKSRNKSSKNGNAVKREFVAQNEVPDLN